MARTMDQVEQIAVTLLSEGHAARPKLQVWVERIAADADYAELATKWGEEYTNPDNLAAEMRKGLTEIIEFAETPSETTIAAWDRADYQIETLAFAVIQHRRDATSNLAGAVVAYVASLREHIASLLDTIDDMRPIVRAN